MTYCKTNKCEKSIKRFQRANLSPARWDGVVSVEGGVDEVINSVHNDIHW